MKIMLQGPGNVPLLPLAWHDMKALESIIIAYLAYRRGTVPPTDRQRRDRHEQEIHILQGLLERVVHLLVASEDESAILLFTLTELIVLKEAISGYASLLMWMVPPSHEREEVLVGLRGLYRDVLQLLSPLVN